LAALRTKPDDDNRRTALDASWDRHRLDVAGNIERAGLRLLVERGIDAVTIEDIAGAAGISRRSFYRYFASPEEIIWTVLCRAMDEWAEVVRNRPPHEPLLESFRMGDARLANSLRTSELFRLALTVVSRSPDVWRRVTGPIQAHVAAAYRDIIAERLAFRGRDTAPAGAIAAAFAAIIIHLIENGTRSGRTLLPGETERAMLAFADLVDQPGDPISDLG
jgi:AcrR family transcriptional regulator